MTAEASYFLAVVPIAEVEAAREEVAARCFGAEEYARISRRRAQTVAGFLAVKQALVEMASKAFPGRSWTEKSFELDHDGEGAPFLVSPPDLAGRVFISISHTRSRAFGLVVREAP